MFRGVYAALFTPFDEAGEIDYRLLRQHVEFLATRGLHGLYVCGNSGQGLFLSVVERQRVLDTVLDQVSGRLTVIAHVASMTLADARRLAEHASSAGADAIASLPPVYWSYSVNEVVDYYRALNDGAKLPCLIYHIPALSAGLSNEALMQLAAIPQIRGLKYTDSNYFQLQELLQRLDGRWIAFSGMDQLFLPGLTMGVVGAIGGNMNTFPELFRAIFEDFNAGHWQTAMDTQALITRILGARDRHGSKAGFDNLTASRALLKLRGLAPGCCRAPMLRQLPAEAERSLLDAVRQALDEAGVQLDTVE